MTLVLPPQNHVGVLAHGLLDCDCVIVEELTAFPRLKLRPSNRREKNNVLLKTMNSHNQIRAINMPCSREAQKSCHRKNTGWAGDIKSMTSSQILIVNHLFGASVSEGLPLLISLFTPCECRRLTIGFWSWEQ